MQFDYESQILNIKLVGLFIEIWMDSFILICHNLKADR